jgi:hypothetical protein
MVEAADTKLNSVLVIAWDDPLQSGLYSIEFEHGTTTENRIIRVNGKYVHFSINFPNFNLVLTFQEILRREWMFKLVVDPHGIFVYRYSLEVNGKPFRDFVESIPKF